MSMTAMLATGRGRLRSALRPHSLMLSNAAAVVASTGSTAILGFAYWWLAARYCSLEAVGLAAAAISMMSLIGAFGEFGLGTLLVGKTPSHRDDAHALVSAALATCLALSLACGLLYVLIAAFCGIAFGSISRSGLGAVWFILGCGITGFALVLDNAFVGLLRSSLHVYRNLAASVVKLGLLGVAIALWGRNVDEMQIFTTWVLGALVSILVVAVPHARSLLENLKMPRFSLLYPLARSALGYHLLDVVFQAPTLIMPFLVATALSPAVNAAFNSAWMILRVTSSMPAALTTVLFTIGNLDPAALAARLRFSLQVSLASALAVTVGFLAFAHFILGFFNPAYPGLAGESMQLLGLSAVGMAVRCHFLALSRLRGRMLNASALFAIGGALELLLAILGNLVAGLLGLTLGWILAVTLQGLVMFPAVARAAGLKIGGRDRALAS
jgi:O-antigen/teichoic acid export membrane protein